MPADGGLGQTLVQQVQEERHENLDDLLAHGNVRGLDVPRSWPVIEVRDGLAKTLCVLGIDAERAPGAALGVDHVARPLTQ